MVWNIQELVSWNKDHCVLATVRYILYWYHSMVWACVEYKNCYFDAILWRTSKAEQKSDSEQIPKLENI